MERVTVEEDPRSAPHVALNPEGHSYPYIYVPDERDKYLNPSATVHYAAVSPQYPVYPAPAPRRKKWIWITAGAVILVIIIVAAVVGGVVGSRSAHQDSAKSDITPTPTPSSAGANATTSTTSLFSSTSTPTNTSTSASAQPTDTTFGATVHMSRNDTCGGTTDSFSVLNSNTYRCVIVPAEKRSIRVSQNQGCKVKTWSGNNCLGLNFRVPDTECHSVLYASVSVDC
ncbi:hypothetical protein BDV25DRAFT_14900 [Aspergillus avenaceus]|uniref:Uncharacterized protein n=1 Tax=Aspergillus avenaceus TaxID=36643 RepID=A0A5N6U5F8_ASPAV|nr:hypothetical protein BDV25DRAFT_14900 [Aspergillus avenaceus]